MLIILSPSKTLRPSHLLKVGESRPTFSNNAQTLVNILKQKSKTELKNFLSVSDKLAEENFDRYQAFSKTYSDKNSSAAAYTFDGEVYRGLDADSWDQADAAYAQSSLRILSGLYGVLKPLDRMQPYRLEMGSVLANPRGTNLYHFWKEEITQHISKTLKTHQNPSLFNLASGEYSKVIDLKIFSFPIIDFDFREYKNGKLVSISFNAKQARGRMANHLIKNRIEDLTTLEKVSFDGYTLHDSSSKTNLIFVR